MPTLNTTPNQGYQLPFGGNDLSVDVARIISAISAIDVDIANALASLASKAGLASPALTGTPTAPTAAPGTDTAQLATTAFVKAALDALIGGAPGTLDTLNELAAALADDADFAATITAAIALKADAAATATALDARVQFLGTGAGLPGSNIGPIWHEDYAAIMTWQTFDANSASYTGYASVDVGMPVMDGHSSPRAGFVKRNGASLSKTTYAPLWNWALHHGRVGSWSAGAFIFGDNGDGTFKVPDNRGEFERAWDDGRGVDSGRSFGSAQAATSLWDDRGGGALEISDADGIVTSRAGVYFGSVAGAFTAYRRTFKPRNVALLACIKF